MKIATLGWTAALGLGIATGCTQISAPSEGPDSPACGADCDSPSGSHDGTAPPAASSESGGSDAGRSEAGASDGGGSEGGPPAPGQLFSTSSPWNVAATGTPDPASATMISSGKVGSLKYSFTTSGKGFDIAGLDDYPDYGVPFYEADASSPRAQVKDKYGWWTGFQGVPIPEGATPAIGTDHHLSIWDVPNHTLYEFWEAQKNADGTWSAGAGVKFDSNGTGYQTTPGALSARAYGGSLIAGAIRLDEMKHGVIPHALGMAYPWTRGKTFALGLGLDGITQNIACHSDNVGDANRNTSANIPEGARFRLKSSVDVDAACGASQGCKVIGAALKKYGAYVVDTAGVATFYAEVLTGKGTSWSGLLSALDARAFAADDFELLALPAALTAAP